MLLWGGGGIPPKPAENDRCGLFFEEGNDMQLATCPANQRPPRHALCGIMPGQYTELRDPAGRPVLALVLNVEPGRGGEPTKYGAVVEGADGHAKRNERLEFNKCHVFEISTFRF